MSCRTTCLGPCNLAPVLQVWPEGVTYGGVHEAEVDRILEGHILGGHVVEDLAYPPSKGKQRLRGR
jgi:(2Fe-2S) ferredoxin